METIGEIWLSTYMRNKGLSINSMSQTQKLGSIKTIDLDSLANTLRTSEHRINIDWTKLWDMTIPGLINHINQYSPKAQTSYQDEGSKWLSDTFQKRFNINLNSLSANTALGAVSKMRDRLPALSIYLKQEKGIDISWTDLYGLQIQNLVTIINNQQAARNDKSATSSSTTGYSQTSKNASSSSSSKSYNSSNLNYNAQTSYQDEGSKWLSDTFQKRFNINLNSLSANTALGAVSKMRDKLPALSIYLKQEKGIDISWTNLYGLQIQNLVTIINNQQAARNNKSATSSNTTSYSQTSKNTASSSSSKPYNSSNLNNNSNSNGHSTANSRHNKNFISDWDFEEATL